MKKKKFENWYQSLTRNSPIENNSFLDEVKEVTKNRSEQYGGVNGEWSNVAQLWSALIQHDITPHQVGLMMGALKLSRMRNGYHHDSAIDLAGYAKCIHENAKFEGEYK